MRAAVLTALCVVLFAGPALAQQPAYSAPRGADGHPDFQGVWEGRWMTPIERPPQAASLVLTPEQAAGMVAAMNAGRKAAPGNTNPDSDFDLVSLAKVKGEFRSSLLVDPPDGKLPWTAKGKAMLAELQKGGRDDPEQRFTSERCVAGPGRVPLITVPTNNYLEIIQPPGQVVLHSEGLDDLRVLTLGRQHGPAAVTNYIGDSIARWDGDTLVVETVNFRKDDGLRFSPPMSGMVLSPASVVAERFTRVSEDEIVYSFTVSDPEFYTRAWTAETSFVRSKARLYEYACHEANYSMTYILQAGRAAERKPLKATPKQ